MASIRLAIIDEAQKLISRKEEYNHRVFEENRRRSRRSSGPTPNQRILRPKHWDIWSGFDPYQVRSRADSIAHSIRRAIRTGQYSPRAAYEYSVPKRDGKPRSVSIFPVADSAVSRLLFLDLSRKNRSRLSGRAYAYRPDLTAHDAIGWVHHELRKRSRIFIAEYDFSDFFNTISHDHIWDVLDSEGFLYTPREKSLIRGFLRAPTLTAASYLPESREVRTEGIPLGTSISLFLANVAAYRLDRRLERISVDFARYADDVLVWSDSYEHIVEASAIISSEAHDIGPQLNMSKSEGIRVLRGVDTPGDKVEIRNTTSIGFLGHELSLAHLSLPSDKIRETQQKIDELVYFNLLHELQRGLQDPKQVSGGIDWDYTVLVLQLQRLLYGDLKEADIARMIRGGVPNIRFKGLMSYYPLVDNEKQLLGLDQGLASKVWLAMRRRRVELAGLGMPVPPPHNLALRDLVRYQHMDAHGTRHDYRLPSFRRMSTVLRKAAQAHGPGSVGSALSYDY